MSDYEKLTGIADKECECTEEAFSEKCDACKAAGCLNQCAEDMAYTLKALKSAPEQPVKSPQNAL